MSIFRPSKKLIVPKADLEKFELGGSKSASDCIYRLKEVAKFLKDNNPTNLKYILPFLFNLKGKPYTIDNQYAFEPLFSTAMPQKQVWMAARQLGKTVSVSAEGVARCLVIPDYTILYVTPLFEQIRRLSNNNVRPFIDRSPVKRLFSGTSTENNVLQRSFKNYSKMIFSYAYLDAERVRGVSADSCTYDEVQNIDPSFLPIINECLSASKYAISRYTGTPKTLENTIEGLWQRSSQAEWVVKCLACNKYNIPAMEHDLDNMIGPYRDDISEEKPGVICANPKCQRPISPREHGQYVHAYPERRFEFAGYHIPQIIFPMHYADPIKWNTLLGKRSGSGNMSPNKFYNEVLGVSYDTGSRLITVTDLRAAANLNKNTLEEAEQQIDKYIYRILSVDWGGGGEDEVSFTTLAAMGMLPNGSVECFYGFRSPEPHNHLGEARVVLNTLAALKCSHLVHDYSGAGELRQQFIQMAGFPVHRIIPVAYVRAASQSLMRYIPPSDNNPTSYYRVDKARSLVLTCELIRARQLQFFEYDYKNDENSGLLHDFLSLVEDKVSTRTGSDQYTIIRDQLSNTPDDFAQAVNIGAMSLYYMSGRWPQLAEILSLRASQEALEGGNELENYWDSINDND